tara:strand:- start:2102 stop:2344 length:243 start_codon:yes stop_codon:yes gene_type:complete
MRLNYFQRIVFAGLEVISAILNVFTALIGKNPTWDFEGKYWMRKLDSLYNNRVEETSKVRTEAEEVYKNERYNIIKSDTD